MTSPDISPMRPPMPGWRYEFLGRDLEALLLGDLAVRLDGEEGWPSAA